MQKIRRISPFIVISAVVFLLLTPLISQVNFMQNDDWNRVTSVGRFMQGDLSLLPVTATTFYTQGALGAVFSLAFGINKLPFLTLLVSVLNFLVFTLILFKFFNLSRVSSTLLGLLLFFNPLHIYSAIGFMTENYTLLFLLLSLYFFLWHEKSGGVKNLFLSNILGVLAFLCKQNGIVLYAATVPYLMVKKRYREAFYQSASLLGVVVAYYLFFPITPEMQSKGFILNHLVDGYYTYSLIYGVIIVLSSFLLPLALFGCYKFVASKVSGLPKNYLALVLFLLLVAGLFFTLNKFYKPGKISWEEYPYFENTFERTGFLPRTVHGTKYQFKANYDLYRYWDLSAKVLCTALIASLVFLGKRLVNLFSVYIAGYLLLMVFTETFFDRYILALLPFTILFLLQVFELKSSFWLNALLLPFVLFLAVFSTQLAYDFVYSQNYIWGKSESLVKNGVLAGDIYPTIAWRKLHGLDEKYNYLFSFDSPEVNQELKEEFVLAETYKPAYKFNIFIKPAVYLYQRK